MSKVRLERVEVVGHLAETERRAVVPGWDDMLYIPSDRRTTVSCSSTVFSTRVLDTFCGNLICVLLSLLVTGNLRAKTTRTRRLFPSSHPPLRILMPFREREMGVRIGRPHFGGVFL